GTLARSTLLLAWLPAAMALALRGERDRRQAAGVAAQMFLVAIVVVSTATIRNWIVARQFVLVTSSGSVKLYLGNTPSPRAPAFLDRQSPRTVQEDPFISRTVDYARAAPREFLAGLWRKALYAAGWFSILHDDERPQLMLLAAWIAAVPGLFVVLRRECV